MNTIIEQYHIACRQKNFYHSLAETAMVNGRIDDFIILQGEAITWQIVINTFSDIVFGRVQKGPQGSVNTPSVYDVDTDSPVVLD